MGAFFEIVFLATGLMSYAAIVFGVALFLVAAVRQAFHGGRQ